MGFGLAVAGLAVQRHRDRLVALRRADNDADLPVLDGGKIGHEPRWDQSSQCKADNEEPCRPEAGMPSRSCLPFDHKDPSIAAHVLCPISLQSR